jgi:hypothetical protein
MSSPTVTATIPEQVTISGDVLYRAMRDVEEVRMLLSAFTAWAQIPLTDKLESAVEALGEALGGLGITGGISDAEEPPLALKLEREATAAVADQLEALARSVRG